MAYQALYRKWRPCRFEDVCGQEHITTTLKKQISENKVGHAYLFTGTRGTGKTTCAKIMAKALNCLNSQNGEPCGLCENCKMAENDTLYDIVEIDAASKSKVEDVRRLIDEIMFAPSVGKYKVYIVDEVHMMTGNAFNALLKTLEEPPEHTVFILATTEIQKVPATILSRCQRFDFKRLSVQTITNRLQYIAKEDKIPLNEEAADYIGILADGALRDGLSLLEQCQTYTDITVQTIKELVGIAGIEDISNILFAVKNRDYAEILSIIDRLYKDSKKMENLLIEVIDACRDLLLIVLNNESIIERTESDIAQLKKIADNLTAQEILYWIDTLSQALSKTTKNSGNKTITEIAFIKICNPELSIDMESINARLTVLETNSVLPRVDKIKTEVISAPETAKAKELPSEAPQVNEPEPEKPKRKASDLDFYTQLKNKLNENPATMSHAAFLVNNYKINNDTVIFSLPSINYSFLSTPENNEILNNIASQVLGRSVTIKFNKL